MKSNIAPEEAAEILKKMVRIRQFENKVSDFFNRGLAPGTTHLYAGEEAVAVGACAAVNSNDVISSTHRGHGHCIARGGEVDKMLAEICGKAAGYCRGRGGSIHIADVTAGNLGANGVVGGGLALATGAALSFKIQKLNKVAVCFFGDGAVNQGVFHESLNMAATWKLPIVYVCENNLYGMSVKINRSFPNPDISIRAKAYDIPGENVDGMNVLVVKEAVSRAAARARSGQGPSLLVCQTYRYFPHSGNNPQKYQLREEEEEWKKKCPIQQFSQKMINQDVLTEKEVIVIQQQVKREIAEAEEFALNSSYPKKEELATGLYLEEMPGVDIRTAGPRKELTYRQALNEALEEEMDKDSKIFIIGEDIGPYGGCFGVTKGLYDKYGPNRVRETAISEAAIVGASVGAALTGLRPIAEIMFVDFTTTAMDQIINQMAKIRYLFGSKSKVPMVLRTVAGSGAGYGPQHSQSLEVLFAHIPGLKVVMPSTSYDAKGLLKSAIRSDNPIIFLEHKMLYDTKGKIPTAEYFLPIGKAAVRKSGSDVTIITYSYMVMLAVAAAKRLEQEGISAEVIDLRTIKPLDMETVCASVKKTKRALIVHEDHQSFGVGAEVVSRIIESIVEPIKIKRLGGVDVPVPMSPVLEKAAVPQIEDIIKAVKEMIYSAPRF
ncbi:MAG: dehydrogenase E1 component subunit alpha/beta [Patescibacteria group bacterium]|jgi:pyruvate/2-oxoglutarate/acetoin dehydrogenase E1 component/TPP-dependent pyruvate/acetoin dehydrogenase alpha subunit